MIIVLVSILPCIALLYLVAAFMGHFWKVNSTYKNQAREVTIFVSTNGAHTDFIMPVQHELFDWSSFLDEQYKNLSTACPWIGIGWGDKGFYLDTPEWEKLKFSTAFNALFGRSNTLMHVTFHPVITKKHRVVALKISKKQYAALLDYILPYFRKNEKNKPYLLKNKGYTSLDDFYEANKQYSWFITCNVWTNSGLKAMGMRTALWAPFELTIIHSAKALKRK